MIMDNNFLKKIRSVFNLNEYEGKIWTALLSKGIATAGELSDIGNVPRSRSYDVLESLEKRGFIIMKLGKPIKYIAVDPNDVINRVKRDIKTRAESSINDLESVVKTPVFNELNLLYKNGIRHVDPQLIAGAVQSRRNLYNQMDSMFRKAKKSIVIATSADGFVRKIDNFRFLFKKLSDKGVQIRIMAPLDDKGKKLAKTLGKVARVKDNKDIDARFVLVDDSEMLFMVTKDGVHEKVDTGVWVNSEYFVKAMRDLFNKAWKNS
jgi:sugar-specific transcriptional regulator TrmB